VQAVLMALIGLMPELLQGVEPTLASFSRVLGTHQVLVKLREIAAEHLQALPAPVGFSPRHRRQSTPRHRHQHCMGRGPPR
jgi:hypothetical protein